MTLFEEALMMLERCRSLNARKPAYMDDEIEELILEAIKRLQADHDALVAEHAEAEGLLVRATTAANDASIRNTDLQQRVRWGASDDYR